MKAMLAITALALCLVVSPSLSHGFAETITTGCVAATTGNVTKLNNYRNVPISACPAGTTKTTLKIQPPGVTYRKFRANFEDGVAETVVFINLDDYGLSAVYDGFDECQLVFSPNEPDFYQAGTDTVNGVLNDNVVVVNAPRFDDQGFYGIAAVTSAIIFTKNAGGITVVIEDAYATQFEGCHIRATVAQADTLRTFYTK